MSGMQSFYPIKKQHAASFGQAIKNHGFFPWTEWDILTSKVLWSGVSVKSKNHSPQKESAGCDSIYVSDQNTAIYYVFPASKTIFNPYTTLLPD